MPPESLEPLSKEELIALVLAQAEQTAVLLARVAELEARLNVPPKTPRNSSLPPSTGQKSNRPEPPAGSTPKPPRRSRPGVARQLAAVPDHVRDFYADRCEGCGERVYACSTRPEAEAHALRGHCISVPVALVNGLSGTLARNMTGRPHLPSLWAQALFGADPGPG